MKPVKSILKERIFNMGYRHYITVVSKDIIHSIQSTDSEEKCAELLQQLGFDDASCDPSLFNRLPHISIGKPRDGIVSDFINTISQPLVFFDNSDTECRVGGVELLDAYIQYEHAELVARIKELNTLEDFEKNRKDTLRWLEFDGFLESCKTRTAEIELAGSWLREHAIFNAMALRYITDWDANYVVFSGW